jgi:hypothetical protein
VPFPRKGVAFGRQLLFEGVIAVAVIELMDGVDNH